MESAAAGRSSLEIRGASGTRRRAGSPWEGLSILLVDDEPLVLSALVRLLRRVGFRTLTATNGQEALEVLRAHVDEVSLVLTDIAMPVLRGDQSVKLLRELRPGLPIILHSGAAWSLSELPEADPLRTRFLSKPWKPTELLLTIVDLLSLG